MLHIRKSLPLAVLLLIAGLAVSVAAQTVTIPAGHPRVWVRSSDIPAIQQKLTSEKFASVWQAVQKSDQPLTNAFRYLVQADRTLGRKAVKDSLSALNKCTDARTPYNAFQIGACVYDWCFPLLVGGERQAFITEFKRIAAGHSPGYPANPSGHALVGHDTEGWLLSCQLSAGVAMYDEDPSMYNAAQDLFFGKFVPARNFVYKAHMHHQGDSYNGTRLQHDLFASWLFRRLNAGDVMTREQQYNAYQVIYHFRPDGLQMKSGDTYDDLGTSSQKRRICLLSGSYYNDPYLLHMADQGYFSKGNAIDGVFELLFRSADVDTMSISRLPRTKFFPHPMGEMVARTGWELGLASGTAVVQMRIGNYFFGNHQRKDFGTFQIYYRGPLAIASGIYEGVNSGYGSAHWQHYYHQTIAHNGLLIYDPEEVMARGTANDGGQYWPNKGRDHPKDLDELLAPENGYKMGEVTAHDFGPHAVTPEYSYIAGDISAAYHPNKVNSVLRSMVTFSTGNPAFPLSLVVYDRIESKDPRFKKTWLLHSVQEPKVAGTAVSISNTTNAPGARGNYSGKLWVNRLLPQNAAVEKIGGPGKEFWIESVKTNYATSKKRAEPGAWRIEISPAAPAAFDNFLNVLTVTDMEVSALPAVQGLSSGQLTGAVVLDRVVLFNKGSRLLSGPAAFTLSGTGTYKILVTDLLPGTWVVEKDGGPHAVLIAADEKKCIYFHGGSGIYALRLDHTADGASLPSKRDLNSPGGT